MEDAIWSYTDPFPAVAAIAGFVAFYPDRGSQRGGAGAMTVSRAVRFDHYGGREVLYVTDVPVPAATAGEVVVSVRAAGINPGEASIRSGALDNRFPATFPSGEGSDLAGVVVATGEGVEGFAVGDKVLGFRGAVPATPISSRSRRPS